MFLLYYAICFFAHYPTNFNAKKIILVRFIQSINKDIIKSDYKN